MTSIRLRLALTALFSLSILPFVYSKNFFPCHPSKASPNFDVSCSRVVLPPRLCKSCPLRPTDKEGSFVDCQRIYDTEAPECHDALQKYVDENECDHVRREALKGLKDGDEEARSVIDYFLYSVCEQCCDCVPMGTKRTDYVALASAHQPDDPFLWTERRGNCPAHAQFDVCKVLPNVKYFTKPGGPEVDDAPEACPLLRDWQKSDAASEWEITPETDVPQQVQTFLRGLLNAVDCDNFSIWTKCHQMEEKQNHLLVRDEFDFVPEIPTTEPPTSTTKTMAATTETTTTETTATTSATTATTTDASKTSTKGSTESTSSSDDKDPEASDNDSSPSGTQSADLEDGGPNGSPSPRCFPSSAVVELRSGEKVAMRDLQIGDWVRVSEKEFSQVFLFTHRTAHVYESFVEILVGNRKLQVTDGHIVYVNGIAVPARDVKESDTMRTMEGIAVVKQVTRVYGKGLYNPQTVQGDIVVDGVVVSTFTTAVERFTATALLMPIRGLFMQGWIGEMSTGGWFKEGYRSVMPIF